MSFIITPTPTYVSTEEEALKWANYYSDVGRCGYDTETTGLDLIRDKVLFFSFADETTRICAPIRLLRMFKDVLANPGVEMRMTNANFDRHMSANHQVHIDGFIYDTIPMDFLIDENRQGRHGLKQCSLDYLGLQMASFSTVFGSKKNPTAKEGIEYVKKILDALETNDETKALAILAQLGRLEGMDDDFIEAYVKCSKSLDSWLSDDKDEKGYTTKTLLRYARSTGFATKTTGKAGYVVDICDFIGIPMEGISKEHREELLWVYSDEEVTKDFNLMLVEGMEAYMVGETDEDALQVIQDMICDYASLDAWVSYNLVPVMLDRLEDIQTGVNVDSGGCTNLREMYEKEYEPLIHTSFNMERRGVKVDLTRCKSVHSEIMADLGDVERSIVNITGKILNLNSHDQVRSILYENRNGKWYDKLGRPARKFSGTGDSKLPSTKGDVLEELALAGMPVAKLLVEYKKFKKIEGFVRMFPEKADGWGRLHTSFNVVGARTGRWASRGPNMQNIPSKGKLGKLVRGLFIPEEGNAIIVADYGQLEMRILAHLSGDENMCEAINAGRDLHSATAYLTGAGEYDAVYGAKVKADEGGTLTEEETMLVTLRGYMKTIGFGLNYGMGAVMLAKRLGLAVVRGKNGRESSPEAEDLIEQYFDAYPRIREFMDATKEDANDNRYVQTVTGRFRRLPEVTSQERWVRMKALRQAGNSVIQGSAADIINKATVDIEYNERLKELDVVLLLQIHDELVLECPDIPEVIEEAKVIIQRAMEDAIILDVPMEAVPGSGYSWGEAK